MSAPTADHHQDDDARDVSGAGVQHEEGEPTPGSDGDGPEAGYTSPAELGQDGKPAHQ